MPRIAVLICLCAALAAATSSPAEARWRRSMDWQPQPQSQMPMPIVEHAPLELTPVQFSRDRKVDGSTRYNEDRFTDLPTGDEKLYTTVTVSDGWQGDPRQTALVQWFTADPRLARLKVQTHFNQYTPSNPHWNKRLRPSYGDAVPMVTVQSADGNLLLHLTSQSIPSNSGALADMVDDALAQRYAPPRFNSAVPLIVNDCPDGQCPPVVQPNTEPLVGPVMPEVKPNSPAKQIASGLFIVILGVAAVVAIVVMIQKGRKPEGELPGIFS